MFFIGDSVCLKNFDPGGGEMMRSAEMGEDAKAMRKMRLCRRYRQVVIVGKYAPYNLLGREKVCGRLLEKNEITMQ